MRQRGGDVRELMHDGCPTACVDDAAFGYVNAFKDHVNVGFFFGALLKDTARLLEGTGKRGRHVKLRPGCEVDSAALANSSRGGRRHQGATPEVSGAPPQHPDFARPPWRPPWWPRAFPSLRGLALARALGVRILPSAPTFAHVKVSYDDDPRESVSSQREARSLTGASAESRRPPPSEPCFTIGPSS